MTRILQWQQSASAGGSPPGGGVDEEVCGAHHCESVDLAADGEAAIAMVRDGSYDLVLLDLMLPKANGLAVSEAIQALPVKPKVIVLSAISRYFADRFPEDTLVLQKPFDINRIEDVLRTLADD